MAGGLNHTVDIGELNLIEERVRWAIFTACMRRRVLPPFPRTDGILIIHMALSTNYLGLAAWDACFRAAVSFHCYTVLGRALSMVSLEQKDYCTPNP
jgi:hypothetical protein